jgi:hypothetical protein
LSLSTIKYSLVPSFFIFALIKQKKILFISISILLLSVLIFAFKTSSFYLQIFIQPIIIAQATRLAGISDFSSVISHFLNLNIYLSLGLCLLLSLFLVILIMDSKDEKILFSSLCIINLFILPHASYDYIFLLPLLCLFIGLKKTSMIDYFYLFPVLFYFFIEKLDVQYFKLFYSNGPQTSEADLIYLQLFGSFILLLSFFALYFKQKNSQNNERN